MLVAVWVEPKKEKERVYRLLKMIIMKRVKRRKEEEEENCPPFSCYYTSQYLKLQKTQRNY